MEQGKEQPAGGDALGRLKGEDDLQYNDRSHPSKNREAKKAENEALDDNVSAASSNGAGRNGANGTSFVPRRFEDLDIEEAAELLGGKVQRDGSILCPGPDDDPDDERSLHITPSDEHPEGFVVHSFADDDWKLCRVHVSKTLGLSNEPLPPRPPLSEAERAERAAKRELREKEAAEAREFELACWAGEKWDGAATDDWMIDKWFEGRGLTTPPGVLRIYRYKKGVTPRGIILGRIEDPVSRELRGYHRTYVWKLLDFRNPNRVSVEKNLMDPNNWEGMPEARLVKGSSKGVIRLIDGAENNRVLMVGEGIETALSAPLILKIDGTAVWATVNCNMRVGSSIKNDNREL